MILFSNFPSLQPTLTSHTDTPLTSPSLLLHFPGKFAVWLPLFNIILRFPSLHIYRKHCLPIPIPPSFPQLSLNLCSFSHPTPTPLSLFCVVFNRISLIFSLILKEKMNSTKSYALPIIGFMFLTLLNLSFGQSLAPSPAPEGPISDGTAIDQGIAYVLLVVALAVTYLLH